MEDSQKKEEGSKGKVATFGAKLKGLCMSKLEYVVTAGVCIAVLALALAGAFDNLEHKYYDMYVNLSPEIKPNDDIMLVLIDDTSIEEIGVFPWSRDIIADMTIRMKELGAKTLVFDIEYLDPSALSVNPSYVRQQFPAEYKNVQNEIIGSLDAFAEAVASQNVPLNQVLATGRDISDYLGPVMDELYGSITSNIFRDNDLYFANALRYFGGAFLTVNAFRVNKLEKSQAAVDYAYENLLYKNVEDPHGYIKSDSEKWAKVQLREYGIGPALLQLVSSAAGAGFPNIMVDSDGVRRRYRLFSEYNGRYVAQLVFEPALKQLQPEKIIRYRSYYKLVGATLPSEPGQKRDLIIPVDKDGNVLIHWVKRSVAESFKGDSAFFLYDLDRTEDVLLEHIQAIANMNVRTSRGYVAAHEVAEYLLGEYAELSAVKDALLENGGGDFDAYFARRAEFFEDAGSLAHDGFEQEIFALFDAVREANGDDGLYRETQEAIESRFAAFASDYELYQSNFRRLKGFYDGAFCLIGNSSTATTDLGATPFIESYANIGTHANLYNTIISNSFIRPVPRMWSLVIMFACSVLFAMLFRRLKTLGSRLLSGTFILLGVIVALFALFAFGSVYVESLAIIISIIVNFMLITVVRFVLAEKDKDFLRKAFSTYLSGDIIDEIVKDPKKLALGGEEKELTAIFTDVRSFSTLSEKVTPTQLVYILNTYLSRMSDIVLENQGTIDKFEGDAIIAFYGAPLDNPQHARCALMSAIRMKQAEADINEYLLSRGEAPNELLTRIGINSGPMVVGNMGTDAKMNYTIMGNDVNLAARLEGVNKVYGTWILASESTFSAAGEGFVGRRLDRVRVVGINTPVQLYNVIGLESETPDNVLEGVALFHDALDTYLARDFAAAMEKFAKVQKAIPEDAPSAVFMERARKLLATGVPDEWDGVVNMTSK